MPHRLSGNVWWIAAGAIMFQIAAMIAWWMASDRNGMVLATGVSCTVVTVVFAIVANQRLQRAIARAEQEVKGDVRHRLEALRSDFAANVSHELRTPITNIRGYVETLQEVGIADAEQTAKFLDVIQRNTERLSSIVEDLLALARLEQPDSKGTLRRSPVTVREILEAAAAQFENERKEKQIELVIDLPREHQINVNPQLMEQAIGNLLSNAIKYSPPQTRITMRSSLNRKGEVELAISDQGPGISSEHLPRLFERFYRVDRARSRELGGTGLGLAIVKHIALVHGGRVDVESEVGRGTTFRMYLPATS